jgi:hypothetical protein
VAKVSPLQLGEHPLSWKCWSRGWHPFLLMIGGLCSIVPPCGLGWLALHSAGGPRWFPVLCWFTAAAYFLAFVPLVYYRVGREIARAVKAWDEQNRAPEPPAEPRGPDDGREF